MFERLRSKKPDKIRRGKPEIEGSEKLEKAPWWIRLAVDFKSSLADTDPFKIVLILITIAFVGMVVFGFLFPWIEVMQEFTYKIPVLIGISGFSLGWFLADYMNKSIRENICEVTFEGETHLADNRKLDIYEGGELLYLVNYYGKPIYNKDLANMRRYGKQKTIFVPRQVLSQFGSVLGRRAKAYPDCKLQATYMDDVDHGVLYIPRKLSESRLLKKLEAAEQNLGIANDMIEKYNGDIQKVVKDLRGHEAEQLKTLIKEMSGLQEAFMGTPQRLRQLVNEQMYHRYGRYGSSPYSNYSPYGSSFREYGRPSWNEVAGRGNEEEEEEE